MNQLLVEIVSFSDESQWVICSSESFSQPYQLHVVKKENAFLWSSLSVVESPLSSLETAVPFPTPYGLEIPRPIKP